MALSGSEVFQVTGVDNLGRPSGATETVSALGIASYTIGTAIPSGQIPHLYFPYSTLVATGTNQNTAAPVNSDLVAVVSVVSGAGVLLPSATTPGAQEIIANLGLNNLNVYPNGTDSINTLAPGAAFIVPPGYAGEFIGIAPGLWTGVVGNVPSSFQYNTNTAIGSTQLTTANITGNFGFTDVTLALTGALTGAATATLPVASGLTINTYTNQGWRLRIINASSVSNGWTIAASSGWSLGGTMTIQQNTWRDFYVTLPSATSAVLQNIGTGTYS